MDLGKTVIKIQCSYKISMKQKMCLSHDFSSQSSLSGLETQVMSHFFLGKVVTWNVSSISVTWLKFPISLKIKKRWTGIFSLLRCHWAKFHLYAVAKGAIWLAEHVSVKLRSQNQNRVSLIFNSEKFGGKAKVDWGQCTRICESSILILASVNLRQPVQKSKSFACAKTWLRFFHWIRACEFSYKW